MENDLVVHVALIAESQRYVFAFVKNVYIKKTLNSRHLQLARGIQGRVEYNTATCECAANVVVEPKAVRRYVIEFVIISFTAYKFF